MFAFGFCEVGHRNAASNTDGCREWRRSTAHCSTKSASPSSATDTTALTHPKDGYLAAREPPPGIVKATPYRYHHIFSPPTTARFCSHLSPLPSLLPIQVCILTHPFLSPIPTSIYHAIILSLHLETPVAPDYRNDHNMNTSGGTALPSQHPKQLSRTKASAPGREKEIILILHPFRGEPELTRSRYCHHSNKWQSLSGGSCHHSKARERC